MTFERVCRDVAPARIALPEAMADIRARFRPGPDSRTSDWLVRLRIVANLVRPTFRVLRLAERLGDTASPARLTGGGANSLVRCGAAPHAAATGPTSTWQQ